MDFRDSKHTADEIVFQGADEQALEQLCSAAVLEALATWQSRADQSHPQPELFQLEQTRSFTISYRGEAANYWPDEAANDIGEGLVRDFLFTDGVCDMSDLHPRLFVARYKVQALSDTEYLLVCPYPTAAGNIGGILVVCVNQHLKPVKA